MQALVSELRKMLDTLDRTGNGGSAVAVHLASALAAAEREVTEVDGDAFARLEAMLWPPAHHRDLPRALVGPRHGGGRAGGPDALDKAA